jgi:hypothetical protein
MSEGEGEGCYRGCSSHFIGARGALGRQQRSVTGNG